MSVKYFTGNNLNAHSTKSSGDVKTYPTSRSGSTKPTAWWLPETAPVNNADGIDAKGQGVGSKYDRVLAKISSSSAQNVTKTRGSAPIGKYNLGRMMKWRKTLKKLHTAAGFSAGGAKGERNMFTAKGNNNTGGTSQPKNSNPPLADHYPLYPIDQGK
jgi:hypothetical protein